MATDPVMGIISKELMLDAAAALEAKDAEIAGLRAALETTRLYVKDDMIAHAVTLEGMSLIETIDAALEQNVMPRKERTNNE